MTYSPEEFKFLEETYGEFGTWAIWNYSNNRKNEILIDCIRQNVNLLNNKCVLIGLNISSKIGIWGNFRGGKHDRKLKYALNDSILKGSYMTDLFKVDESSYKDIIINPKSNSFYNSIKGNVELINKNVELFIREMKDIRISSDTFFIILGTEESITGKLYRQYFGTHFPDNKVIYHRHYSSRGTDKGWVESFWGKLDITQDFDQIIEKYK